MKNLKKTTKQSSSIQNKIRKARFVPLDDEGKEKFKYASFRRINKKAKVLFLNLKRNVNSIIQKPRLWLSEFDWKKIKEDSLFFFLDVLVEGATVNFVAYFLFGARFTLFTTISYGLVVVQGISIFNRLKKDGSHEKLPKKWK